jgi:branched-chain amino acid transport system substrate-binding protein
VRGNTAGGKKVEFIVKDDASVPDNALRMSQELVTSDKVSILTGFGNTPAALSVAQLSKRAKIPEVIMVAATSSIMKASPYILRTSWTIPQVASVIGKWATENGSKKFVSIVSDYGPGKDAEEWFSKTLEANGGTVLSKLQVPLANPDFAPFLQRAADAKPEALFVFVPTGAGAAFMKQFVERGLDKSGIKVIAMADVTDDDLLNNMGDPALGVITGGPYSASHDSPENKAFVDAFKKNNGGMRPNMVAAAAWDSLDLIYKTLDKTKGDATGTTFVDAAKGMQIRSPRGPISIDPDTRDIVQDIYMRKVERIGADLYNTEFQTIANVKDPAR